MSAVNRMPSRERTTKDTKGASSDSKNSANLNEKEHNDHVATHAWVYKVGYIVVGLVATLGATLGAALVNVLAG